MTTITLGQHDRITNGALLRTLTAVLSTSRSGVLTFLRITLGLVMLPHGLQKTVGWFGGSGFDGTMGWLASVGVPAVLAFLAILAESAGAAALVAGFGTRLAAVGILANMLVAGSMHRANGFFMNWSGQQAGEGFEYHILAAAMALIVIVAGAGRWSLDRVLADRIH